ncbi:MAG: ion transporter, partial [Paracoccaceae bacterium]
MNELYNGGTRRAIRFRYGLLIFDLVTITFIVATSFVNRGLETELLDLLIGIVILSDVLARLWISQNRWRELLHPYGIADIVVVFSLLAPLLGEWFAFLRVARIFRVLRSYETLRRLRRDFSTFRDYEQLIVAGINLSLFIYLMTALVYETQHRINPDI